MTISVRLNEKEEELVKSYIRMNNIKLSDFVRSAIMEKIEDTYDLKCYEEAMEKYKLDEKTYTFDEVKKELGM